MKGGQDHIVPLSRQALAILESVPRIAGGFVFTTEGENGLTRFYHAVPRLRALLDPPVAPWVIHDLRRTVASGLQRIGVQIPVIEKVLGHRSGTFRGIVAVYQQHAYTSEKREALQRWADHVAGLTK
jgi:integrase